MNQLIKKSLILSGVFSAMLATHAIAQEPVTGSPDESLFTDPDPKLHANKQVALHIVRELLQCNQWSNAGNWLSDRYIQHNPNAASGLKGVVDFFTSLNLPVTENCNKLTNPVVAVMAQGDLVTVVFPREYPNPNKPGETYFTTWFDMWRIVDGKADEHWDPATITARPAGN